MNNELHVDDKDAHVLGLSLENQTLREKVDQLNTDLLIMRRVADWADKENDRLNTMVEAYERLVDACRQAPPTLRQSAELLGDDMDYEAKDVQVMADELDAALAEIDRLRSKR